MSPGALPPLPTPAKAATVPAAEGGCAAAAAAAAPGAAALRMLRRTPLLRAAAVLRGGAAGGTSGCWLLPAPGTGWVAEGRLSALAGPAGGAAAPSLAPSCWAC